MLQKLKWAALIVASLWSANALAQVDPAAPLDAEEARLLREEPDFRVRGTADQRQAAREMLTALPVGTLVRLRGGRAGEGMTVRLTDGTARLSPLTHPCGIDWSADFLQLAATGAAQSHLNPWPFSGEEITRVRFYARSILILEQPFEAGGSFAFLNFPDDQQAQRAFPIIERWVRACRSASEQAATRHRIEGALTSAMLVQSDLNRRREDSRQVVAMYTDFDRIACGRPLYLYSVPSFWRTAGSPEFEHGDEHQPVLLDQLASVQVTTSDVVSEVTLRQRGRGRPLMFAFTGEGNAEAANSLVNDLRTFAQDCRELEARLAREEAERNRRS